MIVQLIALALLIPSALVALYHLLCALAGLWPWGRRPVASGDLQTRFAIVIPAHDEEASISETLRSCDALDYPKDRYRVFVIADNCSDRTSEVADEAGAISLIRQDPRRWGKGHALAWAFERILPEGDDALVVLDADCRIDAQALRAFDARLASGDRVLQADNGVANPDETVISYASAIANLIENDLFYAGKSRLGLSVFLRGTGMVFQRDVLERHAWGAGSVVEDIEYSLQLLRLGVRIRYLPGSEAAVRSAFPADWNQLVVQRQRWVSGGLGFSRSHAFRLLVEGLLQSRPVLIDAGWTLLILVRSLVLIELAVAGALAWICGWLWPGPFSSVLLWSVVGVVVAQGLYFLLGVARLGLTPRRLGLLLGSPVVLARMMAIALGAGLLDVGKGLWTKTPRSVSQQAVTQLKSE